MNILLLVGNYKRIEKTGDSKFPFRIIISVKRDFKEADGTFKRDEFPLYVSEWWFSIEEQFKENVKVEQVVSFKCRLGLLDNQVISILEKVTLF